MKFYTTLLLISFLVGCGSDDSDTNENSSGNTTGTITLSGTDTTLVGTQLDTGFVGSSLAAGGQPDYIVIVDAASTVSFTSPNILIPNLADANNGFVVVVTDDSAGSGNKAISMSIWVSGTKYDYACTTPVSVFIECGVNSFTLDIGSKTVSFNNLTVTNVDTSTVLTMDGTLTW